jgi:small subunit ribosomal protein S16
MIIKHKHIKKNKSINNIVLRLQCKGCRLYHVYDMVVIHKKSRKNKGKVLDKLGFWNPNYNERTIFFNSTKLYYWIERNLIVNYKIKKLLIKFFLNNYNK